MKVLAFSDMHGSLRALKKIRSLAKKQKPDLIINTGDISIFEQNIELLIERLNKIGIPVLIIHGNHEDTSTMRQVTAKRENIKFVHKKIHKVGDYVFVGYGGGGFSLEDKEFRNWTKKIKPKLKGKKVVLITHAPPYGTKLDIILEDYCGNKDIRKFIERNDIVLALCGHIHENEGRMDKINGTKVSNPGPFGKIFRI
jgi:Icc-related predicted phosphoesterase